MIGHLTGTVIHTELRSVILDVQGVGYKIFTNTTHVKIQNEQTSFWTYLAVRENALDLYGFQKKEELDFFELLITVSGIGPKSALSILSLASLSHLRQAITTGDTSHIVKVSGIGKKIAEKIVVELKDKTIALAAESGALSHDMDALEALKALGYSERDAREALKKVESEATTENKIKQAMKLLS